MPSNSGPRRRRLQDQNCVRWSHWQRVGFRIFLLLPIQSCRSVAAHTVMPASSKFEFEQNNQPNHPGKQLLQLAIFQNADIQRCCNPRRTGCALAVIKHGCMDNTLVIIDT